jgi:citrate lyase subunit beta/citryl-CoA lyase
MFVPGHRQKMIDKALGLDADAIMLDIEDGVAPNEKDTARKNIADSLGREKAPRTPARFVRINAIGHTRMDADLEAVVRSGLEGLVCPKVDTVDEVRTIDAILNRKEQLNRLKKGSVKLLIAIESPRGLLNAAAIAAACPRIIGIMFGAEDFGREIGLPAVREGEARDLIYARSSIVIAAASAHVQAIDGVWVDLNDTQGLLAFAKQSRQLGFSGMSCIHPAQVQAINNTFSPTAEEIDYCQRVLRAFEEANARGDGSIAFGGQLIDRPIVERARRTVEMAKSLALIP